MGVLMKACNRPWRPHENLEEASTCLRGTSARSTRLIIGIERWVSFVAFTILAKKKNSHRCRLLTCIFYAVSGIERIGDFFGPCSTCRKPIIWKSYTKRLSPHGLSSIYMSGLRANLINANGKRGNSSSYLPTS